jgi:hypothetical protein
LFCKPVLVADILSLDPSQLSQLFAERIQKYGATGRSTIIQDAYAEDFSCLLRLGGPAKRKEYGAQRDANDLVHAFISAFLSALRSMLHAPCSLLLAIL